MPFQVHVKVPKNAIYILGLTGFAESTVMRYLFCIEGASSPGDAYALSMPDDARALIALQSSPNRASLPTLTRGRT